MAGRGGAEEAEWSRSRKAGHVGWTPAPRGVSSTQWVLLTETRPCGRPVDRAQIPGRYSPGPSPGSGRKPPTAPKGHIQRAEARDAVCTQLQSVSIYLLQSVIASDNTLRYSQVRCPVMDGYCHVTMSATVTLVVLYPLVLSPVFIPSIFRDAILTNSIAEGKSCVRR